MTGREKKQVIRRRCVDNLLYFGKVCLPNIFTMESPEFHKELSDIIMRDDWPQANIVAPRGFAKTSVAAITGTLWHIFCSCAHRRVKRKPRFVVIVSRSRSHSVNLMTTIKNALEYSEPLRALFGYHGQMNARMWREDMIILDTGDIIIARGMQQMVRGLNVHGTRPTYIISDDAEDEENTKTNERMEANLRWFLQALVPSGAAGDCKVVNIGTPQHQRCIVLTLKDMEDWQTRHYSAVVVNGDGEEESLWPKMRTMEWLDEKRRSLDAIGRVSVFHREYLCEVVGDEDQLFRPENMRYWTGEVKHDTNKRAYLVITSGGERKEVPVNIFMGVDPASSVSTNADFTVIMVLALDGDGNRYVVDMVRKRMRPMDVARSVVAMYKKYHPLKTQIETVGYQSMIGDVITREMNVHIPGLAIKNNPRRGKTERIEGLQPLFYQNQVHMRRGEEYDKQAEDFRDELLLFPRGKHDDILDAFWYANKGAYRPYHAIEKKTQQARVQRRHKAFDWMVE